MDAAIISKEHIRQLARNAFARGESRDSCAMKDRAPARHTWLEEYDRLAAAQASPESHIAPHRRARIEARQVEAA